MGGREDGGRSEDGDFGRLQNVGDGDESAPRRYVDTQLPVGICILSTMLIEA